MGNAFIGSEAFPEVIQGGRLPAKKICLMKRRQDHRESDAFSPARKLSAFAFAVVHGM